MRVTSSFGLTDCGRVRECNEDAFLLNDTLKLYGVADGLGGMQAGEIASRMALLELQEIVGAQTQPPPPECEGMLERAFTRINRHIIQMAQQRESHHGMSTTVTACWLCDDSAHFMHAGDSAAFLMRGARLKKLSRDHTLKTAITEGLVAAPKSSPRVWDHVLTRCLGYRLDDKPDTMRVELQENDMLMLCTDGLTRHVSHDDIAGIFEQVGALPDAARLLVDLANTKGGQDNITVVLVKVSAPDR